MKKYYAFLIAGLLAIAFAAPARAEEIDCVDSPDIVTCMGDADSESEEELVVYSSPNQEVEIIAEEDDLIEIEEEPEMWPVYVSLGALGATLVLVILINLTHRRKK